MSFDPEELFKAVERIREAFNRAADTPGPGQRQFQALTRKVESLYTKASEAAEKGQGPERFMMSAFPAIMDLQLTVSRLKKDAAENPAIGQVFDTLMQDIQSEVQGLLPMLGGIIPNIPGIPGLPDFKNEPPEKPRPTHAPKAPRPPKPPKSGGQDF